MTIRGDILKEAAAVICGDRQRDYGDARENFTRIALMWSAYLDRAIRPVDVANMMNLVKIAREATGKPKWDSYVDIAGYAALGAEVSGLEATDAC